MHSQSTKAAIAAKYLRAALVSTPTKVGDFDRTSLSFFANELHSVTKRDARHPTLSERRSRTDPRSRAGSGTRLHELTLPLLVAEPAPRPPTPDAGASDLDGAKPEIAPIQAHKTSIASTFCVWAATSIAEAPLVVAPLESTPFRRSVTRSSRCSQRANRCLRPKSVRGLMLRSKILRMATSRQRSPYSSVRLIKSRTRHPRILTRFHARDCMVRTATASRLQWLTSDCDCKYTRAAPLSNRKVWIPAS